MRYLMTRTKIFPFVEFSGDREIKTKCVLLHGSRHAILLQFKPLVDKTYNKICVTRTYLDQTAR